MSVTRSHTKNMLLNWQITSFVSAFLGTCAGFASAAGWYNAYGAGHQPACGASAGSWSRAQRRTVLQGNRQAVSWIYFY